MLRRADQDADDENERTADEPLKGCREQRRIYVAVSDPGNHRQFTDKPAAAKRKPRELFTVLKRYAE